MSISAEMGISPERKQVLEDLIDEIFRKDFLDIFLDLQRIKMLDTEDEKIWATFLYGRLVSEMETKGLATKAENPRYNS